MQINGGCRHRHPTTASHYSCSNSWLDVVAIWLEEKSRELKGVSRQEELERHEKVGERILQAAIISVFIAFFARYYTGLGLLPGSLHGFTGPLGIILLWIMARWGRNARKDKLQKAKHGRAADLLIALMVFHSFLGFLYIFDVV